MTKIIEKNAHLIMRRLSAGMSLVGSLFPCGEEIVGGRGVVVVEVGVR